MPIRHPAAVVLATHNVYRSLAAAGVDVPDVSLADHIENWLAGYETFAADPAYRRQWRSQRPDLERAEALEARVSRFGYSLTEWSR